MAEAAQRLWVTVADSPAPGQVREQQVELPVGASLGDALAAAGCDSAELPCGIWGRVQARSTLLQPGDRVELYRPLTVDPKVARRERFAQQGARRAGLFAQRRPNSKSGY